jgi:hypothetical protein
MNEEVKYHTCNKNAKTINKAQLFSTKAKHNGGVTNKRNQNKHEENNEGGGFEVG